MQEPSGCYALSTLIQRDKYEIVISFHVHRYSSFLRYQICKMHVVIHIYVLGSMLSTEMSWSSERISHNISPRMP